jgi:hypothetical protein
LIESRESEICWASRAERDCRGGSKDKSKEEEGEVNECAKTARKELGWAGVGRELVSFLVFRFVCFGLGVEIAWSGKDANLSQFQSRAQQGDCEKRTGEEGQRPMD